MSEQTKAALDEAIRLHVADQTEGRIVVAYELVTASIHVTEMGAGSAYYGRETADGQMLHVSAGLHTIGRRLIDDLWDQATDDPDDSDNP